MTVTHITSGREANRCFQALDKKRRDRIVKDGKWLQVHECHGSLQTRPDRVGSN